MQETLVQLRQENYLIALGDFTGASSGTPMLNMVDILAVDMQRGNRDALIAEALQQSEQRPVQILARKVEDVQTFAVARTRAAACFRASSSSRSASQARSFLEPRLQPGHPQDAYRRT
jgi:c-di-GMP-related signal transduction protein